MTIFNFNIRKSGLALFLFFNMIAYGQQSNTLFFMHDIPQSNLINPAVQIDCKLFIGIPVLSSAHVNAGITAFSFNNMFDKVGNDRQLNMEKTYRKMHRVNLLSAELQLNLISLGYRYNEYYFTFNIAEKGYAAFTFPKDLGTLLYEGNTSFLGEEAKFNALRAYASHYREYAFGASKRIDKKLTVGGKAKLLFGKSNFSFNRSKTHLYTDPTTFELQFVADMIINASFPMQVNVGADGYVNSVDGIQQDIMTYLMNKKNKGFAVDLGAIYKYDDKITLSASIIDLGFIRWNSNANSFIIDGQYTYTGPDITTGLTSQEYLDELTTTLGDEFQIENEEKGYFSFLPTQLYLGAQYQYTSSLNFGFMNRTEFFRSKIHPSFTASANADFYNIFSASLSVSYLNNTFKNIGLGIGLHGRGFQFHLISDNILAFMYPYSVRNSNFRFGFNLMLGCPKNKEEKKSSPNSISGSCYYLEKAMRKAKRKQEVFKKRKNK